MSILTRAYNHDEDFTWVTSFLANSFFLPGSFQMWIPSRFENSVFFDTERANHVHLWIDTEELVGIGLVDPPNEIILLTHPDYIYLHNEMISWAEQNLSNIQKADKEIDSWFTYSIQNNTEHNVMLEKLGYEVQSDCEHVRVRKPSSPLLDIPLPDEYSIKPISQDYYDQYVKAIETVFNHPHFTHEVFTAMRKTVFYHEDLNLGAFTKDGSIAAFAMMRIDENKIAEFEPVGTLPEHRKQGLAKALMKESFIRAEKYNPKLFYVGGAPTEEADRLYESVGFGDMRTVLRWSKKIPTK